MKKTTTPKELLEVIVRNLFKDTDLSRVPRMTADELPTFTLEQEERLLAMTANGLSVAWLSDRFWTADKELILMFDPHPWMENEYMLKAREDMPDLTDDEYALASWISKLAALSHALFVHTYFPLDLLEEGLEWKHASDEENFSYSHGRLIDWICLTPYRRVAAMVCYLVLDTETNRAIQTNQAVQDFYAMECWYDRPDWQKVDECETFITKALDGMRQIDEHYEKGLEAGLNDDEIRVLDALYGFAPHEYFEEDFPRVRDICQAAEELLPDKPYVKSEKGEREYAVRMHKRIGEIYAKYDMHYDPSDVRDLTPGYLDSWIYDKYYGTKKERG
jgi:hypothetical protein